jgi:threonyl-tRNA synthetase
MSVMIALQRIYGTAWESPEQLAAYTHLKAEAARRDHRKLGQELDLFSIQEEAGGLVLVTRGVAVLPLLLLGVGFCVWGGGQELDLFKYT